MNGAALDWLNFFLASVKDGLWPFLAIYPMPGQRWKAGRIGIVGRNAFARPAGRNGELGLSGRGVARQ